MNARRRLAAGVASIALVTAACTLTFGTEPRRSPGISRDPAPSQVPTGPTSAAAVMQRLCDMPKIGHGSGVTPEGPTPPAIATVERQVEAVRDLKYTSHVDVRPLTQDQIDQRLTKNFDKTVPIDFYARRSDAWGTIGVIPAATSIRDALFRFQTGQVVGFYNSVNKQLVYIGDTELSLTERFILAHELTHALDDQHFGLSRIDAIAARCDDEAFMAGLGAVEGSAQFFATQVILRFPSGSSDGGGGGGSIATVPPFITNLQLWPYSGGLAFIQQLAADGGTARVDRALSAFPASTEQIIHPERWPNDVPQPVDVPDLGPALGAGWRDLDVMTVGELWLRLMLELRLGEGSAADAATGWDGGLYRAWSDGPHTAVVLRTVWDSPADAQEFAEAMGEWIDGVAVVLPPDGSRVDVAFADDDGTLSALKQALS